MTIENIYWERVNLCLVFNKSLTDKNIFLISGEKKIKLENVSNDILKINVTNTPGGTMLDRGVWQISIDDEIVDVSHDLLENFENLSRNFKYRNGFYTYTVDLDLNDNSEFIIITEFYMRNKKYKKYNRIVEGDTIFSKTKIFFKTMVYFIFNIYYHIISMFRSKKKKVLFLSEQGDKLTGNLKYLCENFEQNGINVTIYSKKNATAKRSIVKLITSYLKKIYLVARHNIIIVENYTPILNVINLRKDTKVVQLWHAGVGFKAVGYARFGKKGSPHPYVSGHRKYNLAITDSEDLIEIYEELFGVDRRIFRPYGMPRLMNYLDKDKINNTIKTLYEHNKELEHKKIILFAPTYRGTTESNAYYDYTKIDLKKIYDFCIKNDFIFIIKMHPFVQKLIDIPKKYASCILEYSSLDINDLIYITDILITDYSSCAYEYSMFERPIIFYRYDKNIYEYLRPMHTKDKFSKEQYEVTTFDECLEILEKLKRVSPKNRFNNLKVNKDYNSCDIIREEII